MLVGPKVVEVLCLVQTLLLFCILPSSLANNKGQDRKFCFFASSELIYENVMKQVAPSAVCEGGGRLLDNKVSLGGVQGVVDDFDSLWGAIFFVDEIDYPSILRYAQSRSQLSFMSQARIALPKVQMPAICRTVDLGIISSGFPFASKNEVAFETTVSQYVERMRQLGAPEKYLRKLTTAQKWIPASFANAGAQAVGQNAIIRGQNSMRRRVTMKTMNQKSSKRFTPYPSTPYPSADDIGAPEPEQQTPTRATFPSTPTTNQVTVETVKQDTGNMAQGITQIVTQKNEPGLPPQQQVTTISNDGPVMSVTQSVPNSLVSDPMPPTLQKLAEDSLPQYPSVGMPQTPTRVLEERLPNLMDANPPLQQNSPIEDAFRPPLDRLSEIPRSPKFQPMQETPSEIVKEEFNNPRGLKPLSQQNAVRPMDRLSETQQLPQSQPIQEISPEIVKEEFNNPRGLKPLPQQNAVRPLDRLSETPQLPQPQSIQETPSEIVKEEFNNPRELKPLPRQNSPTELRDPYPLAAPDSPLRTPQSPNFVSTDLPESVQPRVEDTNDQPLIPRRKKLSSPQKPLQQTPEIVDQPEDNIPTLANPDNIPTTRETLEEIRGPRVSEPGPLQNSPTQPTCKNPRESKGMPPNTVETYGQPTISTEMKPQDLPPIVRSLQNNLEPLERQLENPNQFKDGPQEILTPESELPDNTPNQVQNIPKEKIRKVKNPRASRLAPQQNYQSEPCSQTNPSKPEDTMLQDSSEEMFDQPTETQQAPAPSPTPLQNTPGCTDEKPENTIPLLQDYPQEVVKQRNDLPNTVQTSSQNIPDRILDSEQTLKQFPEQNRPTEVLSTNPIVQEEILRDTPQVKKQPPRPIQRRVPREVVEQEIRNRRGYNKVSQSQNRIVESQSQPQDKLLVKDQPCEMTSPQSVPELIDQNKENQVIQVENVPIPQLSNLDELEKTELNNIQNQKKLQQTVDTTRQLVSEKVDNPLASKSLPRGVRPTDLSNQEPCKPQGMQPQEPCDEIMTIPSTQLTPARKKVGQPLPKPSDFTPEELEDELQRSMLPQDSSQGFTKPNKTPTPLQNTPEELISDRDVNLQDLSRPSPLQDGPTEQCSQIPPTQEPMLPTEQIINPTIRQKKSGQPSPRPLTHTPNTIEDGLQDPTPLQDNPQEFTKLDTPLEKTKEELQDNISSNPRDFVPPTLQTKPMEQYNQVLQEPVDLQQNPIISQSSKKFRQPLEEKLQNPTQPQNNPQEFETIPLQSQPTDQCSQVSPKPAQMVPQEQISNPETTQFTPKRPVQTTVTPEDQLQNPTPLQQNPQKLTKSKTPPTPLDVSLEELLNGTFSPSPLINNPPSRKPDNLQPEVQIPNPTMTPPPKKLGQPPTRIPDVLGDPTPRQNNPKELTTFDTPTPPQNIPLDLPNEKIRNPREFKEPPLQNSPAEPCTQLPQELQDMPTDEQMSNPQTIPPRRKSSQSSSKTAMLQPNAIEKLDNAPLTEPLPQQNDSTDALERKLEEKTQKAALDLHKTIKEVLQASPSTSEQPSAVTDDGNTPTIVKAGKNPQTSPTPQVTSDTRTLLDNGMKNLQQETENMVLGSPTAPSEPLNSETRSFVASQSKQVESKRSTNKETETIKISNTGEADTLEPPTTEESLQTQTRSSTNTSRKVQETERLTSSSSATSRAGPQSKEPALLPDNQAFAQSQASQEPTSNPNESKTLIPGYTLGSLVPEFDILSRAVEPTFLKGGPAVSQTRAKSTASNGSEQTLAKSTASAGPQQTEAKSIASVGPQQTQAKSLASCCTQKPGLPGSPEQVTCTSVAASNVNPAQATSISTSDGNPGKITTTPISTPNASGINIQAESPNGISSTTQLTSKDGSNKVSTVSVSSNNGSPASGTKVVGIRTEGGPGGTTSSSSVVSVVN